QQAAILGMCAQHKTTPADRTPAHERKKQSSTLTWAALFCAARLDCESSRFVLRPSTASATAATAEGAPAGSPAGGALVSATLVGIMLAWGAASVRARRSGWM